MRTDSPVGKKILFLCIFLSWMLRAPGVQAAEDGGIAGPLGARAYWSDGIHFDSPKKNLRLKINGKIAFDYRLKPGVVTKSNALELMRAVGLEV